MQNKTLTDIRELSRLQKKYTYFLIYLAAYNPNIKNIIVILIRQQITFFLMWEFFIVKYF